MRQYTLFSPASALIELTEDRAYHMVHNITYNGRRRQYTNGLKPCPRALPITLEHFNARVPSNILYLHIFVKSLLKYCEKVAVEVTLSYHFSVFHPGWHFLLHGIFNKDLCNATASKFNLQILAPLYC